MLNNAAVFYAFPPAQAAALLLLSALPLVAAGGIYYKLSGGKQFGTTMDEISALLHHDALWWTHAIGDAGIFVHSCVVFALLPMEARLAGKETDAREVAPKKAAVPMDLRPSGSVIETKERQFWKA